MEKEHYIMKMEILNLKVILKKENMMVKENIFMKMEIIIQGNLKKVFVMEKEKNMIKMVI